MELMFASILDQARVISKTATFKDSLLTTSGTFINGVFGALFYVFVARSLGPSDFGLLTITIATMTLIADNADLGSSTGLIRFVPPAWTSDRPRAYKFLKLSLETRLVVWLVVLVCGFMLTPWIASSLFQKPELAPYLRLAMIGVGGSQLFSFATTALQAMQRYRAWSVVNIAANLGRLLVVLALLSFNNLTLFNTIITYISVLFLGFSLSLTILPTRSIFRSKGELSMLRTFYSYNLWVTLFTLIAALSSRLDTFLSSRLLTSYEVGLYGAATQLTVFVPQLVGALGAVVGPKFSSLTTKEQMLIYFKKLQLMVIGLFFLGLLVIPVSFVLIPLFLGPLYKDIFIPFVILWISMLVFLVSVPVHNVLIYYYAKPNIFVWVSLVHFVIIATLGYWLILNYGITGAAVSVLVGNIFNLVIPLGWFLVRIKK